MNVQPAKDAIASLGYSLLPEQEERLVEILRLYDFEKKTLDLWSRPAEVKKTLKTLIKKAGPLQKLLDSLDEPSRHYLRRYGGGEGISTAAEALRGLVIAAESTIEDAENPMPVTEMLKSHRARQKMKLPPADPPLPPDPGGGKQSPSLDGLIWRLGELFVAINDGGKWAVTVDPTAGPMNDTDPTDPRERYKGAFPCFVKEIILAVDAKKYYSNSSLGNRIERKRLSVKKSIPEYKK